jgi:hypothetical protein
MSYPEKSEGVRATRVGVEYDHDPYDSAKSTSADRRDMARMGKPQEMRVGMQLNGTIRFEH